MERSLDQNGDWKPTLAKAAAKKAVEKPAAPKRKPCKKSARTVPPALALKRREFFSFLPCVGAQGQNL